MKASLLFPICIIAASLQLSAEPEAAAKPEVIPMTASEQAFQKLPEENQSAFKKHLDEAKSLFQKNKNLETLAELEKAEAIFKDSPAVHNLRGSCYVEKGTYTKALESFQAAAALLKDNPSIEFNIGEVYFVTKHWQESLEHFEKCVAHLPPTNLDISRLAEFKMLLCMSKLGRDDEVSKLSGKYDINDPSPFFYYAKASLAFADGDKATANDWLAKAAAKFPEARKLAPWQDTLFEYGTLKR